MKEKIITDIVTAINSPPNTKKVKPLTKENEEIILKFLSKFGNCCNYIGDSRGLIGCVNCPVQSHFKFKPTTDSCKQFAVSKGFTPRGYKSDRFLAKLILKERKRK